MLRKPKNTIKSVMAVKPDANDCPLLMQGSIDALNSKHEGYRYIWVEHFKAPLTIRYANTNILYTITLNRS